MAVQIGCTVLQWPWNFFVTPNVKLLRLSQMLVDYSLSDQIFAKAKLQDVKTVKLWLGAGILLEYELEEAQSLLVSLIGQ